MFRVSLLIGALLVAVQRIHVIDKPSLIVSNCLGIGISFVDVWLRLIFLSRKAIDGTKPISVEKKSISIQISTQEIRTCIRLG
jgi:hypothetical protein